jgi:hypothetical protein
MKDRHGGTIR